MDFYTQINANISTLFPISMASFLVLVILRWFLCWPWHLFRTVYISFTGVVFWFWLELARFLILLRQRRLGHRTYFLGGEKDWGGEQTFIHRKGHHTYCGDGRNKWVGTTHNIERKHRLGDGDTAHTLLGYGHRTTFTETRLSCFNVKTKLL